MTKMICYVLYNMLYMFMGGQVGTVLGGLIAKVTFEQILEEKLILLKLTW